MSNYEYIRRDEVLLKLLDNVEFKRDDDGNCIVNWHEVVDQIVATAAEDVEPVRRGHFVKVDNMWSECSECGNQVRTIKKYNMPNYCPACGARMDGESDE